MLAGCAEKPKIEECWSPDAKKAVGQMVHDKVIEIVGRQITDSGKPFDATVQQSLESHMKLTLDDYAATDANQAGAISCSASVSLEVKWPDSPAVTSKLSALNFGILQAEKGKLYQLPNTMQIDGLVARAK